MTTSFPQEPTDEIRAILDELETDFGREVERLREKRNNLIAEGWLFETSFDLWFPTPRTSDRARELLAEAAYHVAHGQDPGWLTVRLYLRFDDEEIDRASEQIDAVVSSCGGGVEGSSTDLSRRRRPDS